jgi:transcription termination factor NusB
MYFEDIYNKVEPLWEREFSLEKVEETETYIESIRKNYNQLDNEFSKGSCSWWEFAMLFAMYQALTASALNKWEKEKSKTLNINEIPISLFEEYFRKNMEPEDEFEGNDKYLSQYKGFKAPCK